MLCQTSRASDPLESSRHIYSKFFQFEIGFSLKHTFTSMYFIQSTGIRSSLHAHRFHWFELLRYEIDFINGVQVIFRTSCVHT